MALRFPQWVGLLTLVSAATALAEPDAEKGKKLAIEHCSHCHVIGDYNRMGGIGNTPSFQWMVKSENYTEIFKTFYARRPHPVFTRVPGYKRWSNAVPYYPEFTITQSEIEDLLAYVETLLERQR